MIVMYCCNIGVVKWKPHHHLINEFNQVNSGPPELFIAYSTIENWSGLLLLLLLLFFNGKIVSNDDVICMFVKFICMLLDI